ncbi:ClpP class serine protease [Bradyrhizobium elkanii]|nr:ClpP class serine protease [Bradyrhizobium elkanii]MCS3969517.1 ClpP class serine protease [Bradyrhizobium japonicum]
MILLVHQQKATRLLGFPIARYIDINGAEDLTTDADVPIDLVLHTPGGSPSLCRTTPCQAVR